MEKIERAYETFLEERQHKNLYRRLINVKHISDREIEIDRKIYTNFSSNDYLGLSFHPVLVKRAKDWTDLYGAGSTASRLITGNLEVYAAVEQKIQRFKEKEAALVMVSGFQTNASVLPALFDRQVLKSEPLVFADRLNHASLHLGCAAAGVRQIRYHHNDMAHLESLLTKHSDNPQPKFIVTESVFSMDGDIAPLKELGALAKRFGCFLICDDAHATGVLGPRGRGLADQADLVIGTFGKALGSFGAYVACSKNIRDYLVNRCAGLIYATALPPSVLGSIDAALDLVPTMNSERSHVQTLAQTFREKAKEAGFDTGTSATQIVPLIIGEEAQALHLSKHLKENGFWATPIW